MSIRGYFGVRYVDRLIYSGSCWVSSPDELQSIFEKSILIDKNMPTKVLQGIFTDPYALVPKDIMIKLNSRILYLPEGVASVVSTYMSNGKNVNYYTLLTSELTSFLYLSNDLPWVLDGSKIKFGECSYIFDSVTKYLELYQYDSKGNFIFGGEPMSLYRKKKPGDY
jgi:hypothetical protein